MTQSRRILWFSVLAAALLLLPSRAAAQSATVTDDAFLSTSKTTQSFNLNGQGISLIVAGSSATDLGTSKTVFRYSGQVCFAATDNRRSQNIYQLRSQEAIPLRKEQI
jgi:hypothetical protein